MRDGKRAKAPCCTKHAKGPGNSRAGGRKVKIQGRGDSRALVEHGLWAGLSLSSERRRQSQLRQDQETTLFARHVQQTVLRWDSADPLCSGDDSGIRG